MMHLSVIIFLAGMSYSAGPYGPSRAERPIASAAQPRLDSRRQLMLHIERWRTEAVQIKPDEAKQALKETLNVTELEITVGRNWDEVAKLLLSEMRNRRASRWEKAYVGRRLVALLSLAPEDDLKRQMRLLVGAFVLAPSAIRDLPKPSVKSSELGGTDADESQRTSTKPSGPTASSLLAERQGKEGAKMRGSRDERIMLINQSLDVLARDFTSLLLQSPSRRAYQAVIAKLTRQLVQRDAGFAQTIKALEEVRLDETDVRLAKLTRNKLRVLAKRFAGPREYTVYTTVKKQLPKGSDFEQIELDFQTIIETSLSKLTQRIERDRLREASEPLERTPGPLKKTPGPLDRTR